ncbi:hypothetical protein NKH77_50270 [Streptomyces sp. M19]
MTTEGPPWSGRCPRRLEVNPLASTEVRSTPSAPTALTVNGPARRPSARGSSVPFVTTTVQLPSAQARSSDGVDGFIGFTAVGDGDGEDGFAGVGEAEEEAGAEADGDAAERDAAADADAPRRRPSRSRSRSARRRGPTGRSRSPPRRAPRTA